MNKEEKIKVDFKLEDIPMIIDTMEQLQQENKQLKERIDKAIEYLKSYDDGCYTDSSLKYKVAELNITELLEILKGE